MKTNDYEDFDVDDVLGKRLMEDLDDFLLDRTFDEEFSNRPQRKLWKSSRVFSLGKSVAFAACLVILCVGLWKGLDWGISTSVSDPSKVGSREIARREGKQIENHEEAFENVEKVAKNDFSDSENALGLLKGSLISKFETDSEGNSQTLVDYAQKTIESIGTHVEDAFVLPVAFESDSGVDQENSTLNSFDEEGENETERDSSLYARVSEYAAPYEPFLKYDPLFVAFGALSNLL